MAVPDGEDLLALLDGLGVANAVLVGLSLGARTSLDFTLTHPGRVDGLVLAGPGMSGMTITDPFIRAEATRTMAALKAGDLPGFVDGFLRQWVDGPRRAPSEVDAGYPRALPGDGDADRRRAPQGRRGVDRGRCRGPARRAAGTARGAARRPRLGGHRAGRRRAGGAGARKVPVPGAGHMVNLEQPAVFNRELLG